MRWVCLPGRATIDDSRNLMAPSAAAAPIFAALAAPLATRCAVIGGGVAGLSCAQRLIEHGWSPTVFDTGRHAPGGRASSRVLQLPNGELPVDHAAQFFTATGAFAEQVREWEARGVVRRWDDGLGVLDAASGAFTPFDDSIPRWIGALSMGAVGIELARGLEVRQDTWVSPQGGLERTADGWLLRASGRPLAPEFGAVAIAHNGKCAERLTSRQPARAVHRLLRARFGAALGAQPAGKLVLNSIYSLTFLLPEGAVPAHFAGARITGCGALQFAVCHSRKRPREARAALAPGEEAWTVFSSAAFGAAHKAPQEAIPAAVREEVTAELLDALAKAVRAPAPLQPTRAWLQLWGAAVPLNCWRAEGGGPPCVLDAEYRIGACGDWLAEPTIQGAWESGRALADALAGTAPAPAAAAAGRFVPVAELSAAPARPDFFVDEAAAPASVDTGRGGTRRQHGQSARRPPRAAQTQSPGSSEAARAEKSPQQQPTPRRRRRRPPRAQRAAAEARASQPSRGRQHGGDDELI